MATIVKFSGDDDLAVAVSEDIEQVLKAFTDAANRPFPLTRDRDGERLYVNPSSVAYWYAREKSAPRMPRGGGRTETGGLRDSGPFGGPAASG